MYRWTKVHLNIGSHRKTCLSVPTSRKPCCLSAGSYSLYLQMKPTIWAQSCPWKYTNCTTSLQERHFPAPLRHTKKQQLYWNWKKLSLQCSSLQPPKLLIGPPNDWATAYGSYWKYPHWTKKNSMRCTKICFSIILATAVSGIPTPEICFLPGQFRPTILAKEHYGESLSVCELDTQPSNWEADTLPLGYHRRSETFVANA